MDFCFSSARCITSPLSTDIELLSSLGFVIFQNTLELIGHAKRAFIVAMSLLGLGLFGLGLLVEESLSASFIEFSLYMNCRELRSPKNAPKSTAQAGSLIGSLTLRHAHCC
jgi:hypothetical protein